MMIDLAARFTILALLAVCFALLRKKAIDTMASGGIKGSTTRLRPEALALDLVLLGFLVITTITSVLQQGFSATLEEGGAILYLVVPLLILLNLLVLLSSSGIGASRPLRAVAIASNCTLFAMVTFALGVGTMVVPPESVAHAVLGGVIFLIAAGSPLLNALAIRRLV